MIDDAEVEAAMTEPPDDDTGLLPWPVPAEVAGRHRGRELGLAWCSTSGRDPLRRVPMMEPLRGTAAHVGRLIDESATAAELLAKLGS